MPKKIQSLFIDKAKLQWRIQKKNTAFFNKRERKLYQWIELRDEFQRVSGRYRDWAVNERSRYEDGEERIEREVAMGRDIYRYREERQTINKYTGKQIIKKG